MKNKVESTFRFLPAALAVAALVGCSNSSNETGSASRSANEPTALAIDTVTATETVKSIDYATRTITLESPDGLTKTYHAGPDLINFNRIQVGDRVRATVADALAVSIRKASIPPNGESVTVSLVPKGAKPGMFVANTKEVTSKIVDINPATRTITLAELAGGPKTIKLASGVNLTALTKGDDVVIRYTDALALYVERP